jgi:hypothetical protein
MQSVYSSSFSMNKILASNFDYNVRDINSVLAVWLFMWYWSRSTKAYRLIKAILNPSVIVFELQEAIYINIYCPVALGLASLLRGKLQALE